LPLNKLYVVYDKAIQDKVFFDIENLKGPIHDRISNPFKEFMFE